MPVACTNCLRFHFGVCWEPTKQCNRCGQWNHIERYCPQARQIKCTPGEPPPGTRAWCDMHGLHADPQLKQKIINALKTSPGSPIWVNGICIYRGYEKHFEQDDEPRGRPFEQQYGRRRSRSPKQEVRRQRYRSPMRERSYSPLRRPSAPMPGLQRVERSPVRRYRTPSPQRARTPPRQPETRAREPARASGSNAVIFNAGANHQENRNPPAIEPVRFQVPPKPALPQYMLLQGVNKNNGSAPRQPLGQITNSTVTNNASGTNGNQAGPARTVDQQGSSNTGPKPIQPIILSSDDDEPEVEDPHFVLGIGKGALMAEITNAFEQRMFEIELEKMSDGTFDPAQSDGDKVWNDSVRILKAARKKLVGF